MTRLLWPVVGALIGGLAAVGLLGLTASSGASEEANPAVLSPELTQEECAAAVESAAGELAMGGGTPALTAGRCELTGEQGTSLTLERDSLVTWGSYPGPRIQAARAYLLRCAGLAERDRVVAEPPDGITGDRVCGAGDTTRPGLSELVVRTDAGNVVLMRIVTLREMAPGVVEGAVGRLVSDVEGQL